MIFSRIFLRYWGSSFASPAICRVTTQPAPSSRENAKAALIPTAKTRRKPSRSRPLTTGFRTKVSSRAMAIGTRISRAQYRIATTKTIAGRKIHPGICPGMRPRDGSTLVDISGDCAAGAASPADFSRFFPKMADSIAPARGVTR